VHKKKEKKRKNEHSENFD